MHSDMFSILELAIPEEQKICENFDPPVRRPIKKILTVTGHLNIGLSKKQVLLVRTPTSGHSYKWNSD